MSLSNILSPNNYDLFAGFFENGWTGETGNSVTGPQGPQGIPLTGPTASGNITGNTGADSPQLTGVTGARGADGSASVTGPTGSSGVNLTAGTNGNVFIYNNTWHNLSVSANLSGNGITNNLDLITQAAGNTAYYGAVLGFNAKGIMYNVVPFSATSGALWTQTQTLLASQNNIILANNRTAGWEYRNVDDLDINTGRFTAPVDGYYDIRSRCLFAGSASGSYRLIGVYLHNMFGDSIAAAQYAKLINSTQINVNVGCGVFMAAGDYVTIRCLANTAGSITGTINTSINYLGN